MATDATVPKQGQILSGWKEIATYLGRGVRTVQRYEKDFALPVCRPAGKHSGAVMARRTDIDAWMRARHSRNDSVGGNYDSLQDMMVQFQKNCVRMRELRTALRQSIAMLQSSIERVSIGRSTANIAITPRTPRPTAQERS